MPIIEFQQGVSFLWRDDAHGKTREAVMAAFVKPWRYESATGELTAQKP
jgi:hypothetical protein